MTYKKKEKDIRKAYEVIQAAMQDRQYAWAWHCNIAMSFYDVGGDHLLANKAAVRFMQIAFKADTSIFEEYQDILAKYENRS
jgi:hypothetical protein